MKWCADEFFKKKIYLSKYASSLKTYRAFEWRSRHNHTGFSCLEHTATVTFGLVWFKRIKASQSLATMKTRDFLKVVLLLSKPTSNIQAYKL